MKRLIWLGFFVIAGCGALSNPVMGPTGEPVTNPDGSQRLVIDEVTSTTGSLIGILTGNPLWVPLVGAAGALAKQKLTKTPAA